MSIFRHLITSINSVIFVVKVIVFCTGGGGGHCPRSCQSMGAVAPVLPPPMLATKAARELHLQGHSQDFSWGGSVCGHFANHTHFKNHAHYLQTKSHSVQQLGCFYIVVHKRVAS